MKRKRSIYVVRVALLGGVEFLRTFRVPLISLREMTEYIFEAFLANLTKKIVKRYQHLSLVDTFLIMTKKFNTYFLKFQLLFSALLIINCTESKEYKKVFKL